MSIKAAIEVLGWPKNRKQFPKLYEVSEAWPYGKKGVVEKMHMSINDGEEIHIEWHFDTVESLKAFLNDNAAHRKFIAVEAQDADDILELSKFLNEEKHD